MALASLFERVRVLVRGGGDLGSGVVYRLYRAGFPVIVTETPEPMCVRRTVAYGSAVLDGQITVDGVTARLVPGADGANAVSQAGEIPVLIDPEGISLSEFRPVVLVDARMAKRSLGARIDDAPLVIGLGPGFEAGVDCHVVIETNRGHDLGRVIYRGSAEPDTGVPGNVSGFTSERVLRAPTDGGIILHKEIGDSLHAGEVIAEVGGQAVVAPFDGVLRGLIHPRVRVTQGLKIGDIDPRARRSHCFTISDKALAIGGGVLEAVLASEVVRAAVHPVEAAMRGHLEA